MRDTCRVFSLLRFPFFRWPVFLFQVFGQPIERSLPKLAILLHPLGGLPERFGIESHFMNAPIAPAPKQPGLLQYAQVFRHSGERHGVRLRQKRHTFIAPRELSRDTPAGWTG